MARALVVGVPVLLVASLWQAVRAQLWPSAALQVVVVAAVGAGAVVLWQQVRAERRRVEGVEGRLAATRDEAAEAQRALSDLFVNLARRNQSLLDRQITLITELEQHEQSPEALAELFKLDHLATRVRRNAESLLVLSGDDPPRRWQRPVPLAEVVRAAVAEVEDYRRVEVLVSEHLEISGRAVADVAHLLAELIENATTYSPASKNVRVRSNLVPTEPPTVVLAIEDAGIGMAEADRHAANRVLAEPMVLDLRGSTMGMHVVSRLARRYGLRVSLAPSPGGGLTALVTLAADLVTERPPAALTPAAPAATPTPAAPAPAPTPISAPAPAPATTLRRPTPLPAGPRTVGDGGHRSLTAATRHPSPGEPLDVTTQHPSPGEPLDVTTRHPSPGEPLDVTTRAPASSACHEPGGVGGGGRKNDALARRVPGAGLSPGMRRQAGPGSGGGGGLGGTSGSGSSNSAEDGRNHRRAAAPANREHSRLALSRFQASQRAGRAVAKIPPGSLAPHPDHDSTKNPIRHVPEEDS